MKKCFICDSEEIEMTMLWEMPKKKIKKKIIGG
jgi:hypothetical protein